MVLRLNPYLFPRLFPGRLRRAAAGAWHVPAGLVFLLRRPRLWPAALLPTAVGVGFVALGLALGFFFLNEVERAVAPAPGRLPGWLALLITLGLWLATLATGAVIGLALALLVAAPLLDRLSRRTEELSLGTAVDQAPGLAWELRQSFKGASWFVAAAPLVFLLGLVPLLGPLLQLGWGAAALAFQQTDSALARRGLDFGARRAWHSQWRWESLGFGLAGLVALLVPFANFFLAPGLAVGGTRLVIEIEELAGARE